MRRRRMSAVSNVTSAKPLSVPRVCSGHQADRAGYSFHTPENDSDEILTQVLMIGPDL